MDFCHEAEIEALSFVFSSFPETGSPYVDFMSASNDGWQVDDYEPHEMFENFDVVTQKLLLERVYKTITRFAAKQTGEVANSDPY